MRWKVGRHTFVPGNCARDHKGAGGEDGIDEHD